MSDGGLDGEIGRRRTFAIISHPDAGKTTITEKMLLLGGLVQEAGTVKARKSGRHAASDWMAVERERGISVTSSVMRFPYRGRVVNLLDTPGHEDFSEDTYRVLTAVDSALMVVDGARGVEERTEKLMEVCRMRAAPVFTFVNKLDRDIRDPLEILDEIESALKIRCAPVNWPLGMGRGLRGVCDLRTGAVDAYRPGTGAPPRIDGPDAAREAGWPEGELEAFREQVELVRGASHPFSLDAYLAGELTPVYFGAALGGFGVRRMLDDFVEWAPPPRPRRTGARTVSPGEGKLTAFVFKIQANMDPRHRDRVAFARLCSGAYRRGMTVRHCRAGRDMKIADAMTFAAGERRRADAAVAGDIIGVHNHGAIRVGDTLTEGEELRFLDIPHFAPELFRRVRLRDPLRLKRLRRGLAQLSEEGSAQLFAPLEGNDLIVGAVGALQFEVVAHRLRHEYKVDCEYEPAGLHAARWVTCADEARLAEFRRRARGRLALDGGDRLAYLAPTRVNLALVQERWPDIGFHATREI